MTNAATVHIEAATAQVAAAIAHMQPLEPVMTVHEKRWKLFSKDFMFKNINLKLAWEPMRVKHQRQCAMHGIEQFQNHGVSYLDTLNGGEEILVRTEACSSRKKLYSGEMQKFVTCF